MNVVRSAAKKPVLTVSLGLDILCTLGSLAMGIYLLASLPSPFPMVSRHTTDKNQLQRRNRYSTA